MRIQFPANYLQLPEDVMKFITAAVILETDNRKVVSPTITPWYRIFLEQITLISMPKKSQFLSPYTKNHIIQETS
jgi:hypothetical protein